MPETIADFSDSELKLLNQTLIERYGRMVPLQTADAEIQLHAESDALDTGKSVAHISSSSSSAIPASRRSSSTTKPPNTAPARKVSTTSAIAWLRFCRCKPITSSR